MPVHPDPDRKLFGFRLDYANGQTDYGLIVAPSRELAQLDLEAATLSGIEYTLIVDDQPGFVDTIVSQYRGLAFLTTEPSCN